MASIWLMYSPGARVPYPFGIGTVVEARTSANPDLHLWLFGVPHLFDMYINSSFKGNCVSAGENTTNPNTRRPSTIQKEAGRCTGLTLDI